MKKLTCKRCGYSWDQRIKTKPKQCPACKSPLWDTDRVRNTCTPARQRNNNE